MPPIRAETDIAASPATVRDVFPDFPKLGEWHDLATVTSATPGKETGHDLVPGDAIVSKVRGMTIKQTFQENTSRRLRWIGPWLGLLTGEHTYEWNPSETIPGGTRMVQSELFTGPLAFFMAPSWYGGRETIKLFTEMNQALKRRAESVEQEKKRAQQSGQ